jgi:hypothetical protein
VLLRVEPYAPRRKVWLSPVLPESWEPLALDGIPMLGARVGLEVNGPDVRVSGLPDDVEVVRQAVGVHPGLDRGRDR